MAELPLHPAADLTGRNTLRLVSTAEFLAVPETLEQVQECLAFARQRQLPVTVLGGGSNVVLRERLPGLVLVPALVGRTLQPVEAGQVQVTLGAGESWDQAVLWCLQQGLSGIENLSWIPGTCGAAPIQNIGAYGVELADVLHSVSALHLRSGELRTFNREACGFRYRDSLFKTEAQGQWLVLSITLSLNTLPRLQLQYADLEQRFQQLPPSQQTPLGVRDLVIALRRRKLPDPAVLPNAGSFFKNPLVSPGLAAQLRERYPDLVAYSAGGQIKLAAGWLIEQAGWKGKRQGAVGMHREQALVLVNEGETQAEALLAVAQRVREDVFNRFGVWLEQEPLVLPA